MVRYTKLAYNISNVLPEYFLKYYSMVKVNWIILDEGFCNFSVPILPNEETLKKKTGFCLIVW